MNTRCRRDRPGHEHLRIKEAIIFAVNPPHPRAGRGRRIDFRWTARREPRRLLNVAISCRSGVADHRLAGVRPEGQEPGPQVFLEIDREKTQALQIDMADLNDTLSSAIGVAYVNDFVRAGRILRVQMQADSDLRKTPEDLMKLPVRNRLGQVVLLGEITRPKWIVGLPKLDRYNGNPSVKIAGGPAPGHSTGESMQAMEEIARSCRPAMPSNGPALRSKSGSPARRRRSCSRCRCSWCFWRSRRCMRAGRFRSP
jgi:multidrug efflux pump